uniref:hypothetical protein n=1 Tax=Altererythrobacter segetis TaxID=1104773 RepID=UPI00140AE838|nr:hypothetical protein [Altererythrobacter segetis]
MDDPLADFASLLQQELIPDWCADPLREMNSCGFKWGSVRLAASDALDFLRAWNSGLVRRERPGCYRAHRGAALEQFFWDGPKVPVPRSYTLWLEPLISFAALARLHLDFGWPADLIGTQSDDWAFDVVCFRPGSEIEHVAGEVKKSASEIDALINLMVHFGQDPDAPPPPSGRERNAYKKVMALRERRAPVFWALGPAGYGNVFRVGYENERVSFTSTDDRALQFSPPPD